MALSTPSNLLIVYIHDAQVIPLTTKISFGYFLYHHMMLYNIGQAHSHKPLDPQVLLLQARPAVISSTRPGSFALGAMSGP